MNSKRSLFTLIAITAAVLVAGIAFRFRYKQKPALSAPSPTAPNPVEPVKPSSAQMHSAQAAVENAPQRIPRPNRFLYLSGGLFFAGVSALLSQSGVLSPLSALCWLMSIALVGSAFGANWKALLFEIPLTLKKSILGHRLEMLVVIAFIGTAAWMQLQIPAPTVPLPETSRIIPAETGQDAMLPLAVGGDGITPVHNDGSLGIGFYILEKWFTSHDLAGLQRLSGLFAVLLVPAVYMLGRVVGGSWTGLFAVGFAAVSGWTLALGKSGEVYPALAFFAALVLTILIQSSRSHKRSVYMIAGMIFAIGWLFSPLFIYMALLLPIIIVLDWLNNRASFKSGKTWLSWVDFAAVYKSFMPRLRDGLATGVIAILVMLPFAFAPHLTLSPKNAPIYDTGLSPTTRFTDSLSSSLLMLVIASDPSPLHGIVNRPVFPPILAVSFIVGLIAWLLTISRPKRAKQKPHFRLLPTQVQSPPAGRPCRR